MKVDAVLLRAHREFVKALPDAAPRPVHDLFHRATGSARERAGRAEVLHGVAAEGLREAGEGLGALLRYRPPTPVGVANPAPSGR